MKKYLYKGILRSDLEKFISKLPTNVDSIKCAYCGKELNKEDVFAIRKLINNKIIFICKDLYCLTFLEGTNE